MSTQKQIAKYALLPGFIPRLRELFGSGFKVIAYYIATIFFMVRLLPAHHPYLQPHNFGRYKIRHVIAEGANQITWDKKHLDQIFIFSLIFVGLIIFAVQFLLAGFALFAQPAFAGGAAFTNLFVIPSPYYAGTPANDIALMTLDRVFGVEGIFNSSITTATDYTDELGNTITIPATAPWPMHLALHQLFRFYSVGIAIISIIIILYYITTIIGETAVSGTPFGQRFNKTWAPVRILLFFALIAPLNMGERNEGLNGAQLLTLYTAKYGSNFATNAWGLFNQTTEAIIGERSMYYKQNLIAYPNTPNPGNISQFLSLMLACHYAEEKHYDNKIKPYIVRNRNSIDNADDSLEITSLTAPDFGDILNFIEYSEIRIVYGIKNSIYNEYPGQVRPICGALSMNIGKHLVYDEGDYWVHRMYYAAMVENIPGESQALIIQPFSHCIENRIVADASQPCTGSDPEPDYLSLAQSHIDDLKYYYDLGLRASMDQQILSGNFAISDDLLYRGWGAAALWYNKIAEVNGDFASAVLNTPKPVLYPEIMETIKAQQISKSNIVIGSDAYSLDLPDGTQVQINLDNKHNSMGREQDLQLASAYYAIYKFWDAHSGSLYNVHSQTNNVILDTINAIFGTQGLFNMQRPGYGIKTKSKFIAVPGNADVHPLALLSSLGRSILEASVRNLAISAGGALGSGVLSILGQFTVGEAVLDTASSFLKTIALSTILVGAMLYYVLPFMPFVYFIFALSGWIKSIFEAMVAMPLWALSHLRIDGEGLPGPGASSGYYLLLEIFLRPILILIGLLASLLIFSALVNEMHDLFAFMVSNVGGASREDTGISQTNFKGALDQLMYTIVYAALVYMMAISCFKMIDQLPNGILRWIGVSVSTFQETAQDPASQLSSSIYRGGNLTIGQLSGAFSGRNIGKISAFIQDPNT